MDGTRIFYNFLSFLFGISVLLVVFGFMDQNFNLIIFSLVYFLIYTILVLILGFKKSEKKSYKISMVIGSIILIGIMPFIYYYTYLRKVLKKEKQTSEIKKQVIEEMRTSGEISNNNLDLNNKNQ
jgi:hypothetical protein